MSKKLTLNEFISRAKKAQNNKYDYSYIKEYHNIKEKLKIYCPLHNTYFYQSADKHLIGQTGCPFCENEKSAETKLKKYGDPHYNNKEKMLKTREQHEYIPHFSRGLYVYNNILFDSSWELYFYIYNKDIGNNIIRNTKSFPLNSGHVCIPDFIVNGDIFEIKGDFLKNQKNWIFKSECYKQNNIKVLFQKDILFFKNYVENKYGKKYVQQFKKKGIRFYDYTCDNCGISFRESSNTRIKGRIKQNLGVLCKVCSNKIKTEKIKQTCLKKYGIDNPGKLKYIERWL